MLKNIKKYIKNSSNINDIDTIIIKNFSKPIETPNYIKQNIKKTIDNLFLNDIK